MRISSRKRLAIAYVFIALCAVIGKASAQELDIGASETFHADVASVERVACNVQGGECLQVSVKPRSGSFLGQTVVVTVNPGSFLAGAKKFTYAAGDRVIVESQMINGEPRFFVADFVRTGSLALLAALFIAAVIAFGGLGGVRSLLGMAASFGVLLGAMLPAILAGYSPVLVSIVGGGTIMLVTLLVSHGWNAKMLCALSGTIVSLAVTGLLSALFMHWAKLSGLADEDVLLLFQERMTLDARGLLLAGVIIGTLGVLDDVTISQTSAVFELKLANARFALRDLYKRATRIGADHVGAAVNTLILAYAGAALPLLLLITANPDEGGILTVLNREVFAAEIVRTLVGSIGLLTAVPFTTLIASIAATRMSHSKLERLCGHDHGHSH